MVQLSLGLLLNVIFSERDFFCYKCFCSSFGKHFLRNKNSSYYLQLLICFKVNWLFFISLSFIYMSPLFFFIRLCFPISVFWCWLFSDLPIYFCLSFILLSVFYQYVTNGETVFSVFIFSGWFSVLYQSVSNEERVFSLHFVLSEHLTSPFVNAEMVRPSVDWPVDIGMDTIIDYVGRYNNTERPHLIEFKLREL